MIKNVLAVLGVVDMRQLLLNDLLFMTTIDINILSTTVLPIKMKQMEDPDAFKTMTKDWI